MIKGQTAVCIRQKPADRALSINSELSDYAKLHINLVTPDDSMFYVAYSKEEGLITFAELRKDPDGVPVAPAIGELTAILRAPIAGGEEDVTEQLILRDFDSLDLTFLLNGDSVFTFRYQAGDQLSACVIGPNAPARTYTAYLDGGH